MLTVLGNIFGLIFKVMIPLVLLYLTAVAFDYVPKEYGPVTLYNEGYDKLKLVLRKDAASQSFTADTSKKLYAMMLDHDKVEAKEKTVEAAKSPTNNPTPPDNSTAGAVPANATIPTAGVTPATGTASPVATDPNAPGNPIDKAKNAIQQYQDSINKEKSEMDKL
jgi:hypothetical protein